MSLSELINFKKLKRGILYAVCVIVTLWLQNMMLPHVAILGVRTMFVPVVVVAVGHFEGGMWGGVTGLVTGYLCDVAFSANTALFLVLFAALGFAAGILADYIVNRRFYSYMIVSALALLATGLCQAAPLWIFRSTPLRELMPTVLLQALWSLPLAVPAYFAVRAISRRERVG